MAIDKIFDGAVDGIADNLFNSVSNSVSEIKAMQQRKAAENVQLVVQALKKIDADIREKYDGVTETFDKRIASIKDGRDGKDGKNGLDGVNGKDGRDGKDGRNGRDGLTGPRGFDGPKGLDGKDGRDGEDGVSVTDAHIDFDGSLIISLSSGRVINVGEVVAADIAEKIKVITNGGGTSQPVLDKLASLQEQIDLIASALVYKGTWNASTNTPALASSVGTANSFYIVSVAGTTNLNGTSNWGVGDWAVFNGSVWQRVEGGAVGNFTDLTVSGTTTLSNLTASTALALNASKEVVSVTNTGTGNNVLATSPTLVTPALGTPSSATLTNATGLPLSSGVTGTLPIANGGTGQTTANAAFNALAPSQASNSGKYLTTNGTDTSWATLSGLGTVTSVSGTGTVNGLTLTGTVTTSGSLTLGGTLSGISNASLTNSSITINGTATSLGGSINVGTVTSVGATVPSFLSITGSPITSSGTLAIGLSGTALPTTSGGTGLTSFTANGVVYASSSSALTTGSALTFDGSKLVNTGYNKSTYQVSTDAVGTFESVGAAYLTYDGATGASVYSRSNASAENTLTFRASTFSFKVGGTQVASLDSSTFSLYNKPILLSGSTSGYTGFAAPATSNFTIYTLPSTDGTSGQSLTTNGSGTLSWASGTGGTVTSVSGTGTVSGISLSGTVTSSGNLTLGGALDLSAYSGAGAFTTLSASSTVTLSGGTANGVLYLNGSKVVTSGSALTFDGTNLLVGLSSALGSAKLQVNGQISLFQGNNFYLWSSGNSYAPYINAPGDAIAFYSNSGSEQMRLTSTGLGIGTSSPENKLTLVKNTTAATENSYGIAVQSVNTNGYTELLLGASDAVDAGIIQTAAKNTNFTAKNLALQPQGGNVGIGTSSPSTKLEVSTTDLNTIFVTNSATTGATTGSGLGFKAYNGTSVTQSAGIFLTSNTWSFGTYSANQLSIGSDGTGGLALRSANSAPIAFFTGGASAGVSTEKMRLDSSGNLGLGVTPSAWGSAYKALQFGTTGALFAESGDSAVYLTSNSFINSAGTNTYITTDFASRYNQENGVHKWLIAPSGTAGNAITFTQAMTLDASGNLWVGTTTGANSKLYVDAGASSARIIIGYNATSVNYLDANTNIFRNGSSTETARIDSSGNLLVGATSQSGSYRAYIYGSDTLNLYTTGTGTSGTPLRIDRAGSTTGATLVLFKSAGSDVGTITTNGTTTAYNTSSDYRLKNTIAPMTGALAKLALLKPCTYKWNADGSDGEGFIAHELAEVVPQCVTGEKDAVDEEGNPKYQGIDTSFLVATLTAALQEAVAKINSLEARLDAANL